MMNVRLFSSVLVLTLFTGCLEELGDLDKGFDRTLTPEVALPIVESRIYVTDFSDELEDVTVSSETDGTIVLNYEQDLFTEEAATYFNLSNQTSPTILFTGLSSEGVPLTGNIQETKSETFELQPDNGERIDVVRLNSGNLNLVVNSSFTVDAQVTLRMNNLLVAGIPFNETVTINPGNNSFDFTLVNSLFNLVLGGSDFNKLEFFVDLELTANGDIVLPAQSLEIYWRVEDPVFGLIIGESDYRLLDTQTGTEPINILNNLTIGDFSLVDPSIQLTVDNTFGLPFGLDVNNLSIKDRDGINHTLGGTLVSSTIDIDAPLENEVGVTKTTIIDINKDNSNISDFLSNIPTEVSYNADVSYPGGDMKIFVLDTSKVKVRGAVRLPLHGSVMDLSLEKEFELDGTVFDEVISASLLFDIENSYPLSVGLLVEFYDSQGNNLLNLLNDDPILVEAAAVDSDGRSQVPIVKEREIVLTESDIIALQNSRSIRIYILMETTDSGSVPVRILDSDFVDLQIGLKTELKF